jgi:hypothetical protein
LLEKGNFGWNSKATVEFETIKMAMVTGQILALPNFSEKNASDYGMGATSTKGDDPLPI